jgi:hypothetical protein
VTIETHLTPATEPVANGADHGTAVNPAPDKFELAADTLRGDIRDALLAEFKGRSKPWQQMTEGEQESVIHRMEHIARGLVDQAVNLVAHQGAPFLLGEAPKFTVKDSCKIEFVVAALPENLIKLANHRGAAVLVLVEPHKYQGHRKPAETDVVGDLAMPKERADEALLDQVGRGNGEASGEPVPAIDPVGPGGSGGLSAEPHADVSQPPFALGEAEPVDVGTQDMRPRHLQQRDVDRQMPEAPAMPG